MDQVSMNDGLEGRETVAFGLAAGEIAVFVLALMAGYAVLRSGLAGGIAWGLAVVVVAGGAALAWGRLAGRPLLEWSLLLARFLVRTRHARVARLRARCQRCSLPGYAATLVERLPQRLVGRSRRSTRRLEAGAVVIPLALRRHDGDTEMAEPAAARAPGVRPTVVDGETGTGAAVTADGHRHSHVVSFFSLKGGTGRTALAVEVAAILAVRGRATAATRSSGLRVGLLDLTERSPGVGLRLGMAPPPPALGGASPASSGYLLTHELGLLVGVPPVPASPRDLASASLPDTLIEAAEHRGCDVVVVDIDCDLSPRCLRVLHRSDQVMVTLTPTAGGVVDAYRSAAVLRGMGLRDRIAYVVNRWRPDIDLGETMADLGGDIVAEIPDDHAVVDAENRHRIAALDGSGSVSEALTHLAIVVENAGGWRSSWRPRLAGAASPEQSWSSARGSGRG